MARPQRLNETQIAELFDRRPSNGTWCATSRYRRPISEQSGAAAEITTASATLSCSATCATPAERCAPASDRLRPCSHSSPPGPSGGVSSVDQWSRRRAATQARCADAASGRDQPELADLVAADAGGRQPGAMLGLIEQPRPEKSRSARLGEEEVKRLGRYSKTEDRSPVLSPRAQDATRRGYAFKDASRRLRRWPPAILCHAALTGVGRPLLGSDSYPMVVDGSFTPYYSFPARWGDRKEVCMPVVVVANPKGGAEKAPLASPRDVSCVPGSERDAHRLRPESANRRLEGWTLGLQGPRYR